MGSSQEIAQRNRNVHGAFLRERFNYLKEQFFLKEETQLPNNIVKDDNIYVELISETNYELSFDQLEDGYSRFSLLNSQKIINPEDNTQVQYKAIISIREGGINAFLKKIENYLDPTKDGKKGPRNAKLLNQIEEVKMATLHSFWVDHKFFPFPYPADNVWWEVWFRKSNFNENILRQQVNTIGAIWGETQLTFAEHEVRLIKGTANQLINSIFLLDNLAELRKPQLLNDFLTHCDVTTADQEEWLNDLETRLNVSLEENHTLISLLDTGVSNGHSLLKSIISDDQLHAFREDWGVYDTEPNLGHGTGMAALALFGDLTELFGHDRPIHVLHALESFKIKHPGTQLNPDLYGALYMSAKSTFEIYRPNRNRVYCLSVTNNEDQFQGRPSANSSAIDKLAFGESALDQAQELVIVSAGNIGINLDSDYPIKNQSSSVQDPAQAFNAIAVGGYTRKQIMKQPGYSPLAPNGGLSPFTTTSYSWEEKQWPNKPDLVLEAGNAATDGTLASQHHELSPISISNDQTKHPFISFEGTSCAAALVSKMAAELRNQYPNYWPETIRGLLIHSADWTEAMKKGLNINRSGDSQILLRQFGYGVPILERAEASANNSLTLILEEELSPYKLQGSDVKYNEYHLIQLPWPEEVLRDTVAASDATITVTLSYFIEPNPGARQYASKFNYQSHELEFALIKPGEPLEEFRRRISGETKDTIESVDMNTEDWTLGKTSRNKGSIKKDFCTVSGVELSERNIIAVYPKKGWYYNRKKLKKYNEVVRYSLIVTIDTPDQNVDIYTPVEAIIETPIPVETQASLFI